MVCQLPTHAVLCLLSVKWVSAVIMLCCACRLPTHIASLTVMGDRIYVADAQESVFFMKYKKAENQLYIYADDTTSRYLTTQLQLDYDTICGADKFGNIFMMRLPSDLSQQVCNLPNVLMCRKLHPSVHVFGAFQYALGCRTVASD